MDAGTRIHGKHTTRVTARQTLKAFGVLTGFIAGIWLSIEFFGAMTAFLTPTVGAFWAGFFTVLFDLAFVSAAAGVGGALFVLGGALLALAGLCLVALFGDFRQDAQTLGMENTHELNQSGYDKVLDHLPKLDKASVANQPIQKEHFGQTFKGDVEKGQSDQAQSTTFSPTSLPV